MLREIDHWEQNANGGWRVGKWLDLEDSVQDKLAKVLQCDPQDVGISASLTIGMHSLLATFYRPVLNKRTKIVMLESEFTSDILAAESWVENYQVSRE